MPQFCDRVFWKVLILLSKDILNFDEVIMGLFKSKKDKLEKEELEAEDEAEKLEKVMQFGSLLTLAMTQATTTCRLTMDEVIINAFIGIIDKEAIF